MKPSKDTKETNCLSSILTTFFNGGKKQPMFLKKVRKDKDGYITECFTKRGGEAYGEFTEAVYSFGRWFNTITDLKNFLKSLENIGIGENATFDEVIEETDDICGDCY